VLWDACKCGKVIVQNQGNIGNLGISLSENRVEKAIWDFIAIPVAVLLWLYVTASFVGSMLQLNIEAFEVIFIVVGGVPILIYYVKKVRKASENGK
jgi:uncharacterized membrane-anchored protein